MAPDKSLIKAMSLEEKCEWLEAIWVSIESDDSADDVPEWHREILKQRLARMESDPHPGYTIEELFTKLADKRK